MIAEFYGNHPDGYDRIPQGCPGDFVHSGIARSDYGQDEKCRAISPYWDGIAICEVPDGSDFSVDPPVVPDGFQVIEVREF